MPSFISKCFNKKALKRDSSFELLRLYSTFLVIMRHIRFFVYRIPPGEEEYFPVMLLQSLTSVCDNEFILLSGYFGCKRRLKVSRFIPILLQNWTYSVGLYLFAVYIGWSNFSWEDLWRHCLPITYTIYWFTAPFIISQIIFDPIYRGLQQMHRNYFRLIVIITFFLGTLACNGLGEHIAIWGDGTNICLFFMFLIYGSYIRFYEISPSFIVCFIGAIAFSAIHYFGLVGYFSNYLKPESFLDVILKTDCIYGPFASLASIFVFFLFRHFKLNYFFGTIVNFMSDYNYGIYTSHCHGHVIYHIMRQFVPTVQAHKRHLWLYLIRDTLIIYCGCFIVEMIRSMICNYFIFNTQFYSNLCNRIDSLFEVTQIEAETHFALDDNLMTNIQDEEAPNVREKYEVQPQLLVNQQV